MISIVIASANRQMLGNTKKNIEQTIGTPYEIIPIENNNGRGLCEVYNEGAALAKYDIICFAHEDLIFKTKNWGEKLIQHFNTIENVGLIGVAGSTYKSMVPSGWAAHSHPIRTDYANFIQKFKYVDRVPEYCNRRKKDAIYTEVKVLDGLWLCTTKKIISEIKFDSNTFKGFHCYDLDFALNVGMKHKVVVVFDILIKHLSEGHYSKVWVTETLKLQNKWKGILPVFVGQFSENEVKYIEKRNFRLFIASMRKLKFSRKEIFQVLWQTKLKAMDFSLYIKMHLNVITNPYKKR